MFRYHCLQMTVSRASFLHLSPSHSLSLSRSILSHAYTRAIHDRTKDNRGAACRVPQRSMAFGCAGCPKGVRGRASRGSGTGSATGTKRERKRERRNGDGSQRREETERAESRKAKRSRPAGRRVVARGGVGTWGGSMVRQRAVSRVCGRIGGESGEEGNRQGIAGGVRASSGRKGEGGSGERGGVWGWLGGHHRGRRSEGRKGGRGTREGGRGRRRDAGGWQRVGREAGSGRAEEAAMTTRGAGLSLRARATTLRVLSGRARPPVRPSRPSPSLSVPRVRSPHLSFFSFPPPLSPLHSLSRFARFFLRPLYAAASRFFPVPRSAPDARRAGSSLRPFPAP